MRSLSGANLFAIAMASRRCVCCKAHLYLQMRYVRQPRLLCRGATVYAASKAKPNIRRSRHGANGCAARHTYISKYHMTRHRLLCRGATVYAASGQDTVCSAEALQYMRQAKRSRIYCYNLPRYSATFSSCHLGVDVAPHIPTEAPS